MFWRLPRWDAGGLPASNSPWQVRSPTPGQRNGFTVVVCAHEGGERKIRSPGLATCAYSATGVSRCFPILASSHIKCNAAPARCWANFSPLQPPMAALPPSEKTLGTGEGQVLLTNGGRGNLPTHVRQHSDPENIEIEPVQRAMSGPRAAWERFNGHGRKPLGLFQSIKAVVFSSCTFISIVCGCSWNSLRISRLERVVGLPSDRLGFPLQTLG